MRPRRQLHQPDWDAQRVPAARTPKVLHCGIVTFGSREGIRKYERAGVRMKDHLEMLAFLNALISATCFIGP